MNARLTTVPQAEGALQFSFSTRNCELRDEMDGNMAAKQSLERAQYGRPLDKTSTQYATLIRKKNFTIFEFACLQAGIDPTSFDGSFLSEEVKEIKLGPYIRELLGSVTKEKGEDDDIPF